jgi:hypothetical protein
MVAAAALSGALSRKSVFIRTSIWRSSSADGPAALLHAGVDTAGIALWLGHADTRSTQIYPASGHDYQGTSPRQDGRTLGQARPLPPAERVTAPVASRRLITCRPPRKSCIPA